MAAASVVMNNTAATSGAQVGSQITNICTQLVQLLKVKQIELPVRRPTLQLVSVSPLLIISLTVFIICTEIISKSR